MTTSENAENSDAPETPVPLATFVVADVSTLHVHPADLEALPAAESVVSYVDDYGAWVWVPPRSGGAADHAEVLAEIAAEGFSELFCAVLSRAADAGCRYVRLDADAPTDAVLAQSEGW